MATSEISFTGERYLPTEQGEIRLEHFQRYAIALDLVKGKCVLDLACGEGYGSSLMSGVAEQVVGVDVSADAIKHASIKYGRKRGNLKFQKSSAADLPFHDASFDVVVSFETIEHLAEQAQMLTEIRRVLRPHGVLVISSPNRPIYSDVGRYQNEFHVKELDFNELHALLSSQFPAIRYFGQRLVVGSAVMPVYETSTHLHVLADDGDDINPLIGRLPDPVYFIAVCGASEAGLPKLQSSILLPEKLDLLKKYLGYATWAQKTNVEFERVRELYTKLDQEHHKVGAWAQSLDKEIKVLQTIANDREGQLVNLNQVVGKRDDQIGGLNEVVSQRDAQMASLNQSVAERQRQIADLNATVLERERQIANLNQVVGKRDDQIGGLNQSVAECEGQVAALNTALLERDGQIANLNQVVGKRDDQIGGLNQSVAEREGQIAALNTALLEHEEQLVCLRRQVSELNDETVRCGEWGLRLDAELVVERAKVSEREAVASALQATLLAVTNSYCWRLTAPARGFQWVLPTVTTVFNSIPISRKTKDKIAFTAFERMPSLFNSLDSYKSWKSRKDWIAGVIANAIPLETSPVPTVSVIIPVYGQIDFTLRCLDSIGKNPPQVSFEVIVVDDCSPDDSVEVLAQRHGIRLVKNKLNQGFIRSCNHGASEALGEYLHFLNNDTEVTTGWLDALHQTFRELPGTGLVGSKLIYPDGRLQEAGGIIWQDGSAWNFGRFQDAALPVYNYAREVDYCSGASVMVPKKLFDELGGFDEHYLPAYCEDADLALKIRGKDYRVIYQPMSTVVHFEGITSGTDLSQGAKAYQIDNTRKLFDRWKTHLLTYQVNGTNLDRAKDRAATRRVLVLDSCTPTPNQDAGSITTLNLMLLLREMKFQVTFIPEDNFLYMPSYTTDLQRFGIEALYAPYVTSVEQHLRESGNRYDIVFIFRPGVFEKNIDTVRRHCSNAKVLFHTIDLHYLRMEREAAIQADQSKLEIACEMKNREMSAIKAADATIVHSTAEYDILHPELPNENIVVFPLILDIPGTQCTFSERSNIVFVGGYQHAPNIDAVLYFVQDVMPLLRIKLPGVCFYAVGSKPPAEILALASDDVIVTGFVENLNPLLDQMRVSVAPLRYGAGIKGKIGTAMAAGLPVVATSLAVEGMSLSQGDNIAVADGAEAFAEAVVSVYQSEEHWNCLSRNGTTFANEAWGPEAAWSLLTKIVEDLLKTSGSKKSRPLSLFSGRY